MAAISSAIRSNAWNIWIFDYPPCRVQAGTYQAPEDPFLTWKDLFDDLLLCFDLEHYMTGQLLALYLLRSEDVLANNLNTPFIHYNPNLPGSEQILSQIINLTPLAGDEEPDSFITVHVTVIIHDIAHCEETHTDLASHLKSGCAQLITLKRNTNVTYLPIPSGRPSKISTPKTSTSDSPAKRTRCSDLSIESINDPSQKFTVPGELEMIVKQYFKGTCVITGFNTSWGGQAAGPGIETYHIFPKALWSWWRHSDPAISNKERWIAVNSPANCMTMEALSHCIHDNRLLAIHPVSHKIRLFAPIEPLAGRNNKRARFPVRSLVWDCFLKWHYEQTIIENMCSGFLQLEGGAKRTEWRGGPSSVKATSEGEQSEARGGPPFVFPDRTGPTVGGASMARGKDGAAQEKMGAESSNCPDSDNGQPMRQTIPRKRSRSTSVDLDLDTEEDFAADLHIRLLEEASYQERTTDWVRGGEGLICL